MKNLALFLFLLPTTSLACTQIEMEKIASEFIVHFKTKSSIITSEFSKNFFVRGQDKEATYESILQILSRSKDGKEKRDAVLVVGKKEGAKCAALKPFYTVEMVSLQPK